MEIISSSPRSRQIHDLEQEISHLKHALESQQRSNQESIDHIDCQYQGALEKVIDIRLQLESDLELARA